MKIIVDECLGAKYWPHISRLYGGNHTFYTCDHKSSHRKELTYPSGMSDLELFNFGRLHHIDIVVTSDLRQFRTEEERAACRQTGMHIAQCPRGLAWSETWSLRGLQAFLRFLYFPNFTSQKRATTCGK